MTERKGLLYVLIACALFSTGGVLVKAISWNAFSLHGFRSLCAAAILLLYMKLQGKPLVRNRSTVFGGVFVFVTTLLYALALKLTTAANAILIQFTAPVFVLLFSWFLFREKPRTADMVTCLLVFGGISCFFLESLGGGHLAGNLVALGSGMAYAFVFMLRRMPGSDPLSSSVFGMFFGAAFGLPFLLQETDFRPQTVALALLLGVFQMGIAYVFFAQGLAVARPIAAALAAGIEPVLNPLLVALILHERLSPLSALGCVIVFGTIMGYNIREGRRDETNLSKRPPPT